MIPGFSARVSAVGLPVLRVHYSADPGKRPGTPAGDAWVREAAGKYPGGTASMRWRREMEIDYHASGGERLFPGWAAWRDTTPIVIPPRTGAGLVLYGSYDHGWRRPACYLVHGVAPDGRKVTLWEFYAARVPIASIARIILGDAVRLPDGRAFPGNPFAGEERWRRADPEIWAEDQQTDKDFKSVSALFRKEGVYFQEAQRGGDLTIAEWLLGTAWADPMAPLYQITVACPNLIRELGGLRHKDYSAAVAAERGQPEGLVDKDCDSWDALKYFLQAFPPGAPAARSESQGGTFKWWKQQVKRAREGQPVQTYRREMVG